MTAPPLRLTQFARRPAPGFFSIERVDRAVRAAFPPDLAVTVVENRFLSQGLLPRLRDAWRARAFAGDVNHVTGDVHYLTFFLPRARTVLTIHDTVLIERERGLRRVLLRLLWLWLPVRRAGRIVAISEETRRRILALTRLDPARITVIPNPLDESFLPRPPRPGPRFRLLHIGTKANKNLDRVIEAAAGLDLTLTIVGRLTEHQRDLLRRHGLDHENRTDLSDAGMRDAYAEADALVFVSTDEGFGLPILEAQATGRPVLTSARAPMDEVAGGGALLVDPEDTAAIRAALQRLMADPTLRADLVARGQENLRRFRPEAVAQRYAELFREVARRAERRPALAPASDHARSH